MIMLFRVAVFLILSSLAAFAQDWPQWRGPNRDGVAPASVAPKEWPEKLTLAWKIEIGEGHSSPVVVGGRIYVHSRQGDREVVTCLRPEDGKTVWREEYAAPYTMSPVATSHGKGVKSTPVVDNGFVCTLGISGKLSCFDAQSGKPQWRKDFMPPDFGTAMSPVVERGLLIAHVATEAGGELNAFDVRSGAVKWSWKGDGPAYTSPIVVELAGTRQVVTQSRKSIVGLSAATGQLVWRIPFTTSYDQNIVTPVLYNDLLIFSGTGKSVFAVRVSKRGDTFATETVWENKDLPMYMSSPVLSGGLLFGMSQKNRGQFFCLDARNGATMWTSEGRQGENAAIVLAGPSLLMLTADGELHVVKNGGKALERIRKYTVASSPTWAHPVLFSQGILVKDTKTLALWRTR
jgi:outer membrane protein assembly factor BamB